MTVHAHCEERIRRLREALAWYSRCHLLDSLDRDVSIDALEADDALAATTPPDLPLAEGSRWRTDPFPGHSLVDEFGDEYELDSSGGGAFLATRNEERSTESAWLADVLALARREGLV